ncbi:MAG TPA: ATP-binding protein [Burkholderiales bacterium]|nr:ATP-binding protein [Burkholderiales bacterium]
MAEPSASVAAQPTGPLAGLKARLKARPDTEHEQGVLRLVIGALLVLYLLPGTTGTERELILWVGCIQFVVGVAIFLRIAYTTHISPLRRLVAQLADVATISCYMAISGEWAAPLFLIYIWVTLGSGFRFGPKYLVSELIMSVGGFALAIYLNPWWREHTALGIGMLLGMLFVSMYVLSLVRRMFEALARAEAANVAKRRFISVMSHEMRTPLNAIIGMADLLRDTPLTREQADMLQTLRGSSRVLLGLVEDVLDFSKIEAGKLQLEKTDFDLHALVNSTCRIVAAQAASKGIEFVVSIMPEVPPAVRGDPHHLRQIVINLAGNAVKFTERGSVTVHVSAHSETEKSVRLKFSIRDTGIGIPAEAQARIFESFTQADDSTSRRFGGTGLGTTIAKQLVELMGGKLGLESAVGLGSTFWFEVALEKQPERAGLAGAGELAGARVLLVGFPQAQREPLEQALAGWGVTPVAEPTVEDGVARLVAEIALAKPYHSALLYATGEDPKLAQRFRRAAPNPTPHTILSVPRDADVQRFDVLSSGFTAILELPFDKRQLFNVLHSVSAGEEIREGVVRLQDYARRGSAKKLRVLVADDNPTNREVIGKILERGGHTVTLTNDGEQALDALQREQFDTVILDRNMPGVGGIEALQALRLMTRGRDRLPVIILSADATPATKREALEAGADAFLAKPVEALKLLEEIQQLCAAAAERAQPAEAISQARPGKGAEAVPIVNLETIDHLRELGSSVAFVEKLIRVFIADNSTLLTKVEQTLAARNYHELRSLLHAMKGSSASMGTDRLTRLCTSYDKLSDAELRLQAPSLLRTLTEELGVVREQLERYVAERKASAV